MQSLDQVDSRDAAASKRLVYIILLFTFHWRRQSHRSLWSCSPYHMPSQHSHGVTLGVRLHLHFGIILTSSCGCPPLPHSHLGPLQYALVWQSLSVLTMDMLMDQATRWIGAPLYNDMTISLTDILYCLQTIAGDHTTVCSSITWHDNNLWWANGTWTTIITAGYPSPWRRGYGLYH